MGKYDVIKEQVLYDDYNVDYDAYREEYAECYDDNSVLNSGDSDSKFYDWVYSCLNNDWEDLFANLKYSKYANAPCVVFGSLGLWNGRHNVYTTRFEDISTAIKKCVGSSDYAIIKLVNGHIEVCGIHHDGRNYFEIHLLNKLGENTEGADLEKSCYHKKIYGYLF